MKAMWQYAREAIARTESCEHDTPFRVTVTDDYVEVHYALGVGEMVVILDASSGNAFTSSCSADGKDHPASTIFAIANELREAKKAGDRIKNSESFAQVATNQQPQGSP